MVEREGTSHQNKYELPMDMDNSVGIDCGSGIDYGGELRRAKGEKFVQL